MTKFHINKHGVPAPCKATKGNCPLGGETQHFDSYEKAQEYSDSQNAKEYGVLPNVSSELTGDDFVKDAESIKVISPQFMNESKLVIKDDLDNSVEEYGLYITNEEHNPVENTKRMFEELSNEAGELHKFTSEDNPYLEKYENEFEESMNAHEEYLENYEYFNPEYYGDDEVSLRQAHGYNLEDHREIHAYSSELAFNYAKHYEEHVESTMRFDESERSKLKERYKQALVDRVSQFIE